MNNTNFKIICNEFLNQAQADAIVDTLTDLVNYYYRVIFPIKDANEKVV